MNTINRGYNTLEILPGEVGFSGPSPLTPIPNHIPGSSIAQPVQGDRRFLHDIIRFGPGGKPGALYDQQLFNDRQNELFRNDPTNIAITPASPGTGEQRMAGMNPNTIKLLIG